MTRKDRIAWLVLTLLLVWCSGCAHADFKSNLGVAHFGTTTAGVAGAVRTVDAQEAWLVSQLVAQAHYKEADIRSALRGARVHWVATKWKGKNGEMQEGQADGAVVTITPASDGCAWHSHYRHELAGMLVAELGIKDADRVFAVADQRVDCPATAP